MLRLRARQENGDFSALRPPCDPEYNRLVKQLRASKKKAKP
jgi:hypothetical protein